MKKLTFPSVRNQRCGTGDEKVNIPVTEKAEVWYWGCRKLKSACKPAFPIHSTSFPPTPVQKQKVIHDEQ